MTNTDQRASENEGLKSDYSGKVTNPNQWLSEDGTLMVECSQSVRDRAQPFRRWNSTLQFHQQTTLYREETIKTAGFRRKSNTKGGTTRSKDPYKVAKARKQQAEISQQA